MTIGKVAETAGVNVQTIRFYERKGLLPRPRRSSAGYRLYDADSVERIRFVRHAQEIGFSLREIGELLALRIDAVTTCDDVRKRADAKRAEVEDRIRKLENMRDVLVRLASHCAAGKALSDCPILEALDEEQFSLNIADS